MSGADREADGGSPGGLERLVLFDVDGTLLTTGGIAKEIFREVMVRVYGTAGPIDEHRFSGKTDPQIVEELLARAGVDQQTIADGMEELWRHYVDGLGPALSRRPPRVYPGVMELLGSLRDGQPDTCLGLLTGNIRTGARIKLDSAGIGTEQFVVGAFGSDDRDRRRLPEIALERARRHTGQRLRGPQVVIVGDTPADVTCGGHLGVRTVAVATGRYTEEELREAGADRVLSSFSDVAESRRAIVDG